MKLICKSVLMSGLHSNSDEQEEEEEEKEGKVL